jgi:hypothetical protein
MSSATEAELAGLNIMAREAVYIRLILEEMGHEQPPTPLQTGNSMAEAVINGKVQSKWTKAMDMQFHWLQDQECQQQFQIYWQPGKIELCGLLDETPRSSTPSNHAQRIPNAPYHSWDAKERTTNICY